ncbi:gas vesicle protein [Amycolatopsis rhizosphaerae]|uniref:Gas vesicle protein n=1 Tax=Amycolatopsis rhizosphaerae TaxID=2053003 RepID=A0A558A9L2_9PSEU|nr:gas vesicle protein [Amycolatopsis rhizosphaerae]
MGREGLPRPVPPPRAGTRGQRGVRAGCRCGVPPAQAQPAPRQGTRGADRRRAGPRHPRGTRGPVRRGAHASAAGPAAGGQRPADDPQRRLSGGRFRVGGVRGGGGRPGPGARGDPVAADRPVAALLVFRLGGGAVTEPAPLPGTDRQIALVDLLDRVLAGGVVITGELTLSISDVDLVRVSLRALLASVGSLEAVEPS